MKVVLITGALSDIGQATARVFARAGYAVVVNYRQQPDRVARLVDSLQQDCGAPRAIALQADIRQPGQLERMFEDAHRACGRLDVLINNAGVNRDRPFLEMGAQEWEDVLATVLTGTFLCSQAFARRYEGTDGNIINLGAVTAIKGRKNGANYCSARAGVLALTKCMALELAPRIRVNTVTPGRIDTEELRQRYHLDDPERREQYAGDIPLGKIGTPEDVASLMLYLVETGKYITGQNFFVDGGLFMR